MQTSADPTYDSDENKPWWELAWNAVMNWFAEVLNWFNGLEWWVKLLIGLALLVAAVLLTILTGGGVTAAWSDVCSILIDFAFGVVSSVVLYTVMSVRSGEFSGAALRMR